MAFTAVAMKPEIAAILTQAWPELEKLGVEFENRDLCEAERERVGKS